MNDIASKIKYALEYRNMKPKDLSEKTGISRSSISEWLSGKYDPKQDKIFLIAKALEIDEGWLLGLNVPIERKSDITSIYNKLEKERQKKVYSFAEQQLEEQNNKIVNLQNFKEEKQRLEFPWKGYVSAGTGEYMDGETNETICLYEDEIPDEADFALTINGDSMKPMFKDHETIFVKKTNELQSGSIGIVIVNDESYIKKIYYGQFSMTLVSLNSEYDDVYVDRNDNVKFIGKVIL